MSQQPSGWYDDPSNPDLLRYWDGVTWTSHTAPRKSPTASQSAGGADYQPHTPTGAGGQTNSTSQTSPDRATPPMPQGSGWHGQDQGGVQGGAQGGVQGYGQAPQAPQYPGAPGAASWMHNLKTTPDGVPLASWGRRFGAWLIDGIILAVLTYLLARALVPGYLLAVEDLVDAASTGSQTAVQDAMGPVTTEAAKAGILGWVLTAVYCIGFWVTTAQTPGKMALGISVRRSDRPGPLDLVTALKRRVLSLLQILPLVSSIYPIVMLLDGLWPLWDDKRQTLHDKVAQTQVVMGKQPKRGA